MKVNLNRQLLGIEDLLFGTGTVEQVRGGQPVTISKIDLSVIPWDNTTGETVAEYIQRNVDEAQQAIVYVSVDAIPGTTAGATYDTVTNTITFTLPQGPQGPQGPEGPQGPQGIPGSGNGDMTKAVYDTTNNGKVDIAEVAESVVWNNISDKPAIGDMTKAVYDTTNNGKVDSAEVADAVAWSGITGKPAVIGDMTKAVYDTTNNGKVDSAEVADAVAWSGITGLPSVFPPATHNHDTLYEAKNINIQAHISSSSNPHSTTKAQVGLGNADNTSDIDKPVSTAQQTEFDKKLALTGGTMAGAITAIRETKVAMGANNIDLATGNLFTKTISAITTLTVSNVLSSGNANSFILELANGGAFAVTWFAGVKWAGGTAPTLTASGVDILGFYSHDGGTTWRGLVLAKDSK